MGNLGFQEWLAAGRVIMGGDLVRSSNPAQECARFEAALAGFTGTNHALAVNSGTSALVCALQAAGIGPGDEVLVPAYTWMATAAAPLLVGAVPVLVEVDATLTLDPADMARKITPRSRAVIPVHMLNRPCDMDRILPLARKHGLLVIEDACQAVGIRYKGRACGTMGDLGAFSFNQYKNMSAGEGGAVLTNDPGLFARAYNAHDLGMAYRGDKAPTGAGALFLGANYKISELQGAILRVQLKKLPRQLARLERRCTRIGALLRGLGLPVAPGHATGQGHSLLVTFQTAEEAADFARIRGVHRLYDNSKHIYTEWSSVLLRRTAHPRFDPWAWADQGPAPAPEDLANLCPRTLDLLKRTCRVDPLLHWPYALVRANLMRGLAQIHPRKAPVRASRKLGSQPG